MSSTNSYPEIISTLKEKSNLKQLVYDNTMTAFKLLIEVLQDTTNTCNAELPDEDQRIKLEFSHVGDFDARLKVAGDLLVFNMHSNIFQFDRNHEIWKTAYVKDDVMAGYSGIISVYNFLSDSFKYNRMDDLGYLIARIFINKTISFLSREKDSQVSVSLLWVQKKCPNFT